MKKYFWTKSYGILFIVSTSALYYALHNHVDKAALLYGVSTLISFIGFIANLLSDTYGIKRNSD